MWLEAIFTRDELLALLRRVTPARIPLDRQDPERCLWLSKPDSVVFRAEKHIVIHARAQVRWDVLGLTVPVSLRKVSVVLNPEVLESAGEQRLSFGLHIQDADLTGVPAFVEGTLIARVNEALAQADARMSWKFQETLDFKFKLPAIEPVPRMALRARSGSTKVTDDAFSLLVAWDFDAEPLHASNAPRTPDAVA